MKRLVIALAIAAGLTACQMPLRSAQAVEDPEWKRIPKGPCDPLLRDQGVPPVHHPHPLAILEPRGLSALVPPGSIRRNAETENAARRSADNIGTDGSSEGVCPRAD